MYFSKIAILAAATMASTVVADNCFAGYAYCEGNLLTQGSSFLSFPSLPLSFHHASSPSLLLLLSHPHPLPITPLHPPSPSSPHLTQLRRLRLNHLPSPRRSRPTHRRQRARQSPVQLRQRRCYPVHHALWRRLQERAVW